MITGSVDLDRYPRTLAHRVWAARSSVALLLYFTAGLGCGVWAAVTHRFSVPYLGFPTFMLILVALRTWSLVMGVIVIPRRTIVWFRYDRKTFEYRRLGDEAVRSFRPLDVLRIDARPSTERGIVGYDIRLAGGVRLVIDCRSIDNGHEVADQLAADIAHSPRWMFS